MTCAVTVLCHFLLANFSPSQGESEAVKHSQNAPSGVIMTTNVVKKKAIEVDDGHQHDYEEQWFDIWQRSFTNSMDFTVRQFDGWFYSKESDEKLMGSQARAQGRVQLAWEPRSGMLTDTDVRFRIRVKLPALEERVDLLLSDNEDETQD